MHRLLTHLRTRITTRTLGTTTFCDECGEVCTPTCRREAIRDRARLHAQELSLYRH